MAQSENNTATLNISGKVKGETMSEKDDVVRIERDLEYEGEFIEGADQYECSCGTGLSIDDYYCSYCGKRIEWVSPQPKAVHIGNGWFVDAEGNVFCDDEPVPTDELVRLLERERVAHKYLVERMAKAEGRVKELEAEHFTCDTNREECVELLNEAQQRIAELEAQFQNERIDREAFHKEIAVMRQVIGDLENEKRALFLSGCGLSRAVFAYVRAKMLGVKARKRRTLSQMLRACTSWHELTVELGMEKDTIKAVTE